MPDRQIGVLIDFENVGSSNLHNLFDQLSDVGRIIVKRAYADWTKQPRKGEQMLELGIEAKHYFRATGSGKNASDICLAIDAIDLLYRTPMDTFVIVSSDTDFVPLVSTLRAAGKMVIGVGHRGVVSRALVQSCDRYIYLDDGKPTAEDTSDLSLQADELMRRAMVTSIDEQGHVVAAKLHNTMLRIDPSFDYRTLGHRSFTQFLASSKVIVVRRSGSRGDVLVELAATANQVERAATANQKEKPPEPAEAWDSEVDVAWAKIPGSTIAGSKAAAEAAKVLAVGKLSSSRYKNLQGLLDASEMLRTRWAREGNSIAPRDVFHDDQSA